MVIISCGSVISQRNNIDINAFRILKRINKIPIFKTKHKGNKENEKSNEAICTASVINTANRNIVLTAAYCLVDEYGTPYNSNILSFSPGYDNKTNKALGTIAIEDTAISYTLSDLEGCPNDGEHLCEWQGNVEKDEFYFISDVDLGIVANGGYVYAVLSEYAIYEEYAVNEENAFSEAHIWNEIIFD
ncbi:19309_t:CDS:2, partial [Gigaspora rosea]